MLGSACRDQTLINYQLLCIDDSDAGKAAYATMVMITHVPLTTSGSASPRRTTKAPIAAPLNINNTVATRRAIRVLRPPAKEEPRPRVAD